MPKATFKIWRGDAQGGGFQDYQTEVSEGMVVLDAVHQIQAESANDLAARWNCKAGKCGSCSAEVNGLPKLMCMTRLNEINLDEPVTIEPLHAFPVIKDLVTDVSWNFRVKKTIDKFKPRPPDAKDGTWRMQQEDIERVQEFRKCIECFLCQDVCHVLRDHHKHEEFIGPRFLIYVAALEMHPLDTGDRIEKLQREQGIGYCNITKCCTRVCPEDITITDNGIIPLKERVVDRMYDPVKRLLRKVTGKMIIGLKPLHAEAVPRALDKAKHYRLLNEPAQAESICRDILLADGSHQEARVTLILALTDQFPRGAARVGQAQELVPGLSDAYARDYYAGVICERWAVAQLAEGAPFHVVHEWLEDALELYARAEAQAPAGNEDAVLRWNTIVRLLEKNPRLQPRGGSGEDTHGDEVPPR